MLRRYLEVRLTKMLMSLIERERNQMMSNTVDMSTDEMWPVTLDRPVGKELFYVPQPSFIIPIFRAPTTTSTAKSVTRTTTSKIITAVLKHEQRQDENTSSSNLISQRIFENLILTNTVVAAFCIVLMITLTAFLIFLLVPSIRRRWLNEKQKDQKQLENTSNLSRQQSMQQFTLGPSRLNPLFEPTTSTTTTTQFTPMFHPHGTTVLHPTIWASMTPTSVVSSPIPMQSTPVTSPLPPTSTGTRPTTTMAGSAAAARPPLPSHPPTTVQRSPRRR